MGGALWKVDTDMKNTLFVGVDCFHDIVSQQQSIAAFVASTSEELSKWHSQSLFQVVTREEWYDFYIVSQTSQDGTVTPTHYNVIYDTKDLYPDQVQCLTYKLCHMYYNLSSVIQVPAP